LIKWNIGLRLFVVPLIIQDNKAMRFKTIQILILVAILGSGCRPEWPGPGDSGIFTDTRDDHEYRWVRIGSQVWMAENLAYLPSVSPSDDGSEEEARYYVYGYESTEPAEAKMMDTYLEFGVLYNWPATEKVCPKGWHLPTDNDWMVLEKHLGISESEVYEQTWRSSGGVGGQLKDRSEAYWSAPNEGATDAVGFKALPAGDRFSRGGFTSLGNGAFFWSSTESDSTRSFYRGLSYASPGVIRGGYARSNAMSVRCLKN
jgi:uncharacterized protein (TIGR02145 family)